MIQTIKNQGKINILYTDNSALLELLEAEGVRLRCSEKMELIIDSDVDELERIIKDKAPAAVNDYYIETRPNE